jgi:hypothetical protein
MISEYSHSCPYEPEGMQVWVVAEDEVRAIVHRVLSTPAVDPVPAAADGDDLEDAIHRVLVDHGITNRVLSEDEAVDLLMDLKDVARTAAPQAPAQPTATPDEPMASCGIHTEAEAQVSIRHELCGDDYNSDLGGWRRRPFTGTPHNCDDPLCCGPKEA